MAYFSKKFQKLLDLYCRNTLSSFAKISRQELSKIDSEYQTDSSLRSTVQDLSSDLRDKGLELDGVINFFIKKSRLIVGLLWSLPSAGRVLS